MCSSDLDVVAARDAEPETLRAAIRIACRERLSRHKVPTRVLFVPSLAGDRLKKLR